MQISQISNTRKISQFWCFGHSSPRPVTIGKIPRQCAIRLHLRSIHAIIKVDISKTNTMYHMRTLGASKCMHVVHSVGFRLVLVLGISISLGQ